MTTKERSTRLAVEALGLTSAALITWGIWQIYQPAAIIFVGLMCGIPYVLRTLNQIRGGNRQ